MVDVKDKVVTVESLKAVHMYNKYTYVAKDDNVLILVDLNNGLLNYNANDFIGFILETTDSDNNIKQIMFTNKTKNNNSSDVNVRAFDFDENMNMLIYELNFHYEDYNHIINSTLIKFTMQTGEKIISSLPYNRIYGIKNTKQI